jgi:hypothetical protein
VVAATDTGGCESITLSYPGYELPDGTTGWDVDRAEDQKSKDSVTVTLQASDEDVLTTDVMSTETEQRAS